MALRQAWRPSEPATHLWVGADRLVRAKGFQLSLFDAPDPRLSAVADVAAVKTVSREPRLRSGVRCTAGGVRDSATAHDVCDLRGKLLLTSAPFHVLRLPLPGTNPAGLIERYSSPTAHDCGAAGGAVLLSPPALLPVCGRVDAGRPGGGRRT